MEWYASPVSGKRFEFYITKMLFGSHGPPEASFKSIAADVWIAGRPATTPPRAGHP